MENYDTRPKKKKKKINRILDPYLQKKFKIEKKKKYNDTRPKKKKKKKNLYHTRKACVMRLVQNMIQNLAYMLKMNKMCNSMVKHYLVV